MTTLISLLVAALLGMILSPLPVTAQVGSPAAGMPLTPDPAFCTVDPRPLAFFEQLVATPAATSAAAAAPEAAGTPEPFVPPRGEPADAETITAVTAAQLEVVACFNAGDLRRAFALYSEKLISWLMTQEPITSSHLPLFAATPVPSPVDQRHTLLGIREVIIVPDGRVGAFVDFRYADGVEETQYVLYVRQGDRWLVDEVAYSALLVATPVTE